MNHLFPPPPIKPFERLQVTDGLLINADRWHRAHEYHRQRQNVHYQSLNQPGIVCDLGVRLIPAPAEIDSKYRDGRWVEIQSGIAIDLFGNIIVVPQPIEFRISTEPPTDEPVMVYLTVSYVDPDNLHRQETREMVQETFRLDEKTNPPENFEVELCRILITRNVTQLQNPEDVFFPGYNCLDMRYRTKARSRPSDEVRVAAVAGDRHPALSYLLQSVEALYPALQASDEIEPINLLLKSEAEKLSNCHLVYLNYEQSQSLQSSELEILRQYVHSGGVVLVDVGAKNTKFAALESIKRELEQAIASLSGNMEMALMREEIAAELEVIKVEFQEKTHKIYQSLTKFAQLLGYSIESLNPLSRTHPLRIQPFLFSALPAIDSHPIQIFVEGGLVAILGNLSSAWGLDEQLSLPRETIRTAQELGINILHFAQRRRSLTQAMLQPDNPSVLPETLTLPKKQKSLQKALDRLLE